MVNASTIYDRQQRFIQFIRNEHNKGITIYWLHLFPFTNFQISIRLILMNSLNSDARQAHTRLSLSSLNREVHDWIVEPGRLLPSSNNDTQQFWGYNEAIKEKRYCLGCASAQTPSWTNRNIATHWLFFLYKLID